MFKADCPVPEMNMQLMVRFQIVQLFEKGTKESNLVIA